MPLTKGAQASSSKNKRSDSITLGVITEGEEIPQEIQESALPTDTHTSTAAAAADSRPVVLSAAEAVIAFSHLPLLAGGYEFVSSVCLTGNPIGVLYQKEQSQSFIANTLLRPDSDVVPFIKENYERFPQCRRFIFFMNSNPIRPAKRFSASLDPQYDDLLVIERDKIIIVYTDEQSNYTDFMSKLKEVIEIKSIKFDKRKPLSTHNKSLEKQPFLYALPVILDSEFGNFASLAEPSDLQLLAQLNKASSIANIEALKLLPGKFRGHQTLTMDALFQLNPDKAQDILIQLLINAGFIPASDIHPPQAMSLISPVTQEKILVLHPRITTEQKQSLQQDPAFDQIVEFNPQRSFFENIRAILLRLGFLMTNPEACFCSLGSSEVKAHLRRSPQAESFNRLEVNPITTLCVVAGLLKLHSFEYQPSKPNNPGFDFIRDPDKLTAHLLRVLPFNSSREATTKELSEIEHLRINSAEAGKIVIAYFVPRQNPIVIEASSFQGLIDAFNTIVFDRSPAAKKSAVINDTLKRCHTLPLSACNLGISLLQQNMPQKDRCLVEVGLEYCNTPSGGTYIELIRDCSRAGFLLLNQSALCHIFQHPRTLEFLICCHPIHEREIIEFNQRINQYIKAHSLPLEAIRLVVPLVTARGFGLLFTEPGDPQGKLASIPLNSNPLAISLRYLGITQQPNCSIVDPVVPESETISKFTLQKPRSLSLSSWSPAFSGNATLSGNSSQPPAQAAGDQPRFRLSSTEF